LVATKVRAALEFEGMCLQTSSRIVCIAFMVSILKSCMVILKWAALSGGLGRREFARSNLFRFGQRTGQGPAVKAVCNHAFASLFLLTLRLRSPLAATALNLRGAKKRPQHGLRPSAAALSPSPDTTTQRLYYGLCSPQARPSGLPRSDLDNPGGSAVTVVAFTTTTLVAAVAPTVRCCGVHARQNHKAPRLVPRPSTH
jgi:hypothetical protein